MTFTQALLRYIKDTNQLERLNFLRKSKRLCVINSIYLPQLEAFFKINTSIDTNLWSSITPTKTIVIKVQYDEYETVAKFCKEQGLRWYSGAPMDLFNPYKVAPEIMNQGINLYVRPDGRCTWDQRDPIGAITFKEFKETMLRYRQNLDNHVTEIFKLI